jgi:cobalt-precorrin-6B (C15)-methyltransferase
VKDSDFLRGKAPMTKMEVRSVTLDYLELGSVKNFIDIGGGTGSVTVEACVKNKDLNAEIVEFKDEAIASIHENLEKFGVKNRVKVIKAKAPHVDTQTKFERAFIGGSGGNMEEIIDWLCGERFADEAILVINCIMLESAVESIKLLKEKGFSDVDGSCISASRLETLGKGHYFKPLNPCYILKGTYKNKK